MKKVLSVLCVAGLMGCSSSPDIPDDAGEKVNYRSTQDDQVKVAPTEKSQPETPKELSVERAMGPVATVNGQDIGAAEYNKEIDRVMSTGAVPAMLINNAKEQIIGKLVDRRLIDESLKKEGVSATDAEVEAKIEEVKRDFAKAAKASGKESSLADLVKQLGISEDELRQSIRQSVAIEKLLIKRGMPASSEAEAKKFYDENTDKFQQPEQVKVRHILVTVERGADEAAWETAHKAADVLYGEASKKGADFAELAKAKSQGPSAPTGGDLGFVPRGRTVPEFETAAFGLKNGEVSKPVRSPFGWHIIKREGYKAAGKLDYDEVKVQIVARVKAEKIQKALNAYLEELRASAAIELHTENIK